jgi:hypothetical protein
VLIVTRRDQRDAERVLRLLMIDSLHSGRVPASEEAPLRDVVDVERLR